MAQITIPLPGISLSGAKTYIVAFASAAFAGISYWQGTMDMNTAIALAFGASGLGALRHGISTAVDATTQKIISSNLQSSAAMSSGLAFQIAQGQAAQAGVAAAMASNAPIGGEHA